MKIRAGFVSNSSTSSFVVTGKTALEVEHFLRGLTEFDENYMTDSLRKFDYESQCTVPCETTVDDLKKSIADWLGPEYKSSYDYIEPGETVVEFSGTSDNSIPYHVFDIIEVGLNARRFHF